MSLTLSAVTLNSAAPQRTARFWAGALEAELVDGGNGFVHVRAPGVLLIVQTAPDRTSALPTDVHLDLTATDRDAEVSRLLALGATLVDTRADSHGTWAVLRDPDGREFCVG